MYKEHWIDKLIDTTSSMKIFSFICIFIHEHIPCFLARFYHILLSLEQMTWVELNVSPHSMAKMCVPNITCDILWKPLFWDMKIIAIFFFLKKLLNILLDAPWSNIPNQEKTNRLNEACNENEKTMNGKFQPKTIEQLINKHKPP